MKRSKRVATWGKDVADWQRGQLGSWRKGEVVSIAGAVWVKDRVLGDEFRE